MSSLGKLYQDGEVIVRQGDIGRSMFVVQEGTVDVVVEREGHEIHLRRLGKGAFIGEMGIFDRDRRSATVRAHGPARLLTVDSQTLLRRIHEDPSLAFRMVETMSQRIRELSHEVARLRIETGQDVEHGCSEV